MNFFKSVNVYVNLFRWQLEKLQPHSCREGCCGNVDLMPGLRCCVIRIEKSVEVKMSLVIWSVASYIFQLNGVNHLITFDSVKGAMHDNMFNVLCILSINIMMGLEFIISTIHVLSTQCVMSITFDKTNKLWNAYW